MLGPVGCKSKKKLAEEQARAEAQARTEQINRLSTELQAMMADPVANMADLESREARLAEIRAMNLNDPGLNSQIAKVDRFLKAERDRLAREAAPKPVPKADPKAELTQSLNSAFSNIANARNSEEADRAIALALGKFANEDVPVLIIISQKAGVKDYDRPTTIIRYLQYLKDQKKQPSRVGDMVLDSNGRITELELVKNF
jgi:hypothetical protein